MIRSALIAVFAALPLAAIGETCHQVIPEFDYCTDGALDNPFISRLLYPDLVLVDIHQASPHASTSVVAIPAKGAASDPDSLFNLILGQLRAAKSSQFASIGDLQIRGASLSGYPGVQARYTGLHADGGPMGRVLVDGYLVGDTLLTFFTDHHIKDEVDLPAMQAKALAKLRSTKQ
jgi:hypothetical protein